MQYSNSITEKVALTIKKEMEGVCSAHDFFHIERVVKLSQKIQKAEGKGDIEIIEIGALLHESLDDKFFEKGEMQTRKQNIATMLLALGLDDNKIQKIMFIVENVGFGKSLERDETFQGSIEFMIVEDADRLEAIGAIAVARCFAYGGKKGRSIYDPTIKPNTSLTRETYAKSENTSINHFYEKLLLLKDMMHTPSGKSIAEGRHQFMEEYLSHFFAERNTDI